MAAELAELPSGNTIKVGLVINLKTAMALGTIPPSIPARPDEATE